MSLELTDIYFILRTKYKYNQKISKGVALTKLAKWYDKVEKLGLKFFKSVIETMKNHYDTIVNFFVNRSTNASAEAFNSKIKAFTAYFVPKGHKYAVQVEVNLEV